MARVLVTGATGFIGRNVIEGLRRDRRFTVIGSARRHATGLEESADLTQPDEAKALLTRIAPDAIVHAAGLRHGPEDALFAGNVGATRALVDAAASLPKAPRLVIFGSAAEYGTQPDYRPISEHAPCRPLSDYGRTKLEATLLALGRARRAGLDIAVLRAFNVVGPGMGGLPGDVVRHFGGRAPGLDWRKESMSLPMIRDFVSVDDVAEACRRALLVKDLPPIVNICTGVGRSFHALLAEIAMLAGANLAHLDDDGTHNTSDVVVGDPALCERSLGFRPSPDLRRALMASIDAARAAA